MRREFEMSEEQHAKLIEACKPVAYLAVGGIPPLGPRENANRAWHNLGIEMGFVGESARPIAGKGERFFTAVEQPININKDEPVSEQPLEISPGNFTVGRTALLDRPPHKGWPDSFDPKARQLGPVHALPDLHPRPEWPTEAKFFFGQRVECAPGYPYRFPGKICGWYRREDGSIGYSVSREGDPGNVENFSEKRLQVEW